MVRLGSFTRNNLNKQGFGKLDDEAKSRYALPLRFTPGVGTTLIVIGLALQSPIWLGSMALVTLSGADYPAACLLIWFTTSLFAIYSMSHRCHLRQSRDSFPTFFPLSYWRVRPCPSITGYRCWGLFWEEWLSLGAQSSPPRCGVSDRGSTG